MPSSRAPIAGRADWAAKPAASPAASSLPVPMTNWSAWASDDASSVQSWASRRWTDAVTLNTRGFWKSGSTYRIEGRGTSRSKADPAAIEEGSTFGKTRPVNDAGGAKIDDSTIPAPRTGK